MASRQSTALRAFVQSLPPDPYVRDPWSWASVLFRPLADFFGYGIDTLGTPWSCWAPGRPSRIGAFWRPLKPSPGHRGHLMVCLGRGGEKHYRYVHRLVLETFIGPCPPGMQGCHDPDFDPSNNCLSNLRWDTPAANMADMVRHGRAFTLPGEMNFNAKLTEPDVIAMMNRRVAGESIDSLAVAYNVARPTIEAILYGHSWKHLPRPEGLTKRRWRVAAWPSM